ncbi:hypothetical protein BGY98DRAFT_1178359 [Russula aff. rugulosa BPL654]|nr:hypothetical protein BGY98DRAFT_1178359 [Russula aff. rugulosa BPL654]
MPPDHLNPVPDYRKYLQIQDSVHRLCGMEEDVLGPMLGDLVQIQSRRWSRRRLSYSSYASPDHTRRRLGAPDCLRDPKALTFTPSDGDAIRFSVIPVQRAHPYFTSSCCFFLSSPLSPSHHLILYLSLAGVGIRASSAMTPRRPFREVEAFAASLGHVRIIIDTAFDATKRALRSQAEVAKLKDQSRDFEACRGSQGSLQEVGWRH